MKANKALERLFCPEDVSCMLCAGERDMGNGSGLCARCLRSMVKFDGERNIEGFTLHAAYVYRGAATSLIHGLKYENKRYMAGPLIRGLAHAYREKGLAADGIMAVPLYKLRQRQRGFNQSALLAAGLCQSVGAPLWRDMLIRVRDTRQQVGLDEKGRWNNVCDAFACSAPLHGKHVILIDDVCTTGATLLACAHTLKGCGACITLLVAATVEMGDT